MKRILSILILVGFAVAQTPPSNQPNRQAAFFVATSYNYLIDATFQQGLGAQFTFFQDACLVHLANNRTVVPFNTNASVLISDGTNSETIAFQSLSTQTGYCVLRLAATKTHLSYQLRSGTFGLQEAINDATLLGGGIVVVDSAWAAAGGTTAMITGAAGNFTVGIQDLRSGVPSTYAWNGSAYGLLTFGGSPGGSTTQVQVNNGGFFAGIASAGSGAVILANGTSQTKPVIDVRDLGVDCTYTNDSAAVLNAITDNENGFGGTLTNATFKFPPGCHVKLVSSNWKIVNQGSFTIEGASRGGSTISYCGSSATVPVIDMESTNYAEVSNLVVESKGPGCSTGTNVVITVDKANAHSNINATDIFLHDLTLTSSLQGAAGPSGWVGLSISPISASNVEDTRLWNSRIFCNSITNGSVGVNLNNSANAKLEEFKHNQLLNCAVGYSQANGNWSIDGGDTGGNGSDIETGPGSDPALITNIISESNQLLLGNGDNWPNVLISNHVGWGGAGSNGLCGFDLGFANNVGSGNYTLIGNGSDPAPTGAIGMCASNNENVTEINDQLFGQQQSPLNVFASGKDIGSSYGSIFGGSFRATNAAHVPSNTTQYIGYGFISHNGMDMPSLTFNANSTQDCVGAGRPCAGTDVFYLGNENIVFSGVWPIPQYITSCVVNGTLGSQHWNFLIIPVDSAGKRGPVYPFGGNWGCNNAQTTITPTNSLTVTWPRVANATNYQVLLSNPANPVGQSELITTVADSGSGFTQSFTITSGSTGDSFNYVFPQFYEAARTTINGESLNLNAPLTGTVNSTVGYQQNGNALGQFCGTTSTCSATAQPLIRFVYGSAPLVSGTPSAVTITGISPAFTSSTSFVCTATDVTAASALKVANVSASSITITGPNSVTDTVNYTCMGT